MAELLTSDYAVVEGIPLTESESSDLRTLTGIIHDINLPCPDSGKIAPSSSCSQCRVLAARAMIFCGKIEAADRPPAPTPRRKK
jgi:hypothetical protein